MIRSRARRGGRNLTRGQKQGRLIIVSAPSGTGKTTIVERVLKRCRNLRRSISYTARLRRAGEISGRDYHFVSRREFLSKRKRGFFLEWANVFGRYYGTSEAACMRWMTKGRDVILTIDVQGMRKVKKRFGRLKPMMTVFIKAPTLAVLKQRLTGRGTDRKEDMLRRLRIAKQEISAAGEYDHVIVNRRIAQAVRDFIRILKK